MILSRTSNHAFTLIELLTVMAIVAILLMAAIPMVTSLSRSAGLQAASSQVASTLSLARQYAITQRTRTRVVFSYRDTKRPGTNTAPQYLSYSVILTNREAGSWQYMGRWERLPAGTVFLANGGLDDLDNDMLPFVPVTTNARLAYIEFKPTGAATKTATIRIGEGFIADGTPKTTSANRVEITVNDTLGRIQVERFP